MYLLGNKKLIISLLFIKTCVIVLNMTLRDKIKRYFNQFLGLFPRSLPVGRTQFEVWAKFIADTYTLPTSDLRSIQYTLTTILMGLKTTDDRKSPYYFVKVCRAAASKQVAGAIFQEIKTQQKAAEEAAKIAAATASTPAVADVPRSS